MFHLLTSLYSDLTTRPRFNVVFLGSESSGKTTLLQLIKTEVAAGQGSSSTSATASSSAGIGEKGSRTASNPLPSLAKGSEAASTSSLPKVRPTVGQNVFEFPAPAFSGKPIANPINPVPSNSISETKSTSNWFSFSSSSTSSSAPAPSRITPPSRASRSLIHIWDLGGEPGLRSIWAKYFAETDCVIYFWDCERGGQGEGREEEWKTLAGLARKRQLRGLPFLVILSRCDLATSRPKPSLKTDGSKAVGANTESSMSALGLNPNGMSMEPTLSSTSAASTTTDLTTASLEDASEAGDISLSPSLSTAHLDGDSSSYFGPRSIPSPPPPISPCPSSLGTTHRERERQDSEARSRPSLSAAVQQDRLPDQILSSSSQLPSTREAESEAETEEIEDTLLSLSAFIQSQIEALARHLQSSPPPRTAKPNRLTLAERKRAASYKKERQREQREMTEAFAVDVDVDGEEEQGGRRGPVREQQVPVDVKGSRNGTAHVHGLRNGHGSHDVVDTSSPDDGGEGEEEEEEEEEEDVDDDDDDEEEEEEGDESISSTHPDRRTPRHPRPPHSLLLLPQITILPLSSLTRRGLSEVIDWMALQSLKTRDNSSNNNNVGGGGRS